MRKFAFSFVNIFFVSLIISVVVSVYMMPAFGGGVDTTTFTLIVPLCTAIGTVVGSVFASIVPVGPLAVKIAHCLGAKPGSLAEVLLRNMTIITVMLFIMCLFITVVTHYVFGAPMPGDISMAGDINALLNAWFVPIPMLWAPCYVVSLMVDPLCFWLAVKICGNPFAAPSAPTEG